MLIQRTADLVEEGTPWSTWFIYGPTGSGKTRRAATFPAPLFIIPANEGSHITLLQLGSNFDFVQVGKDPATRERVPARAHMDAVLADLERRHRQMIAHENKGEHEAAAAVFPWSTIVFESLTHYCDLVQEDISRYGTVQMNQQSWGQLSTHLRTIHDRIRNLDVHVVYTALEKTDQKGEGAGSAVEGGPNMTGAMARKMPSACEVIAYCEVVPAMKPESPPIYRTYFRQHRQFAARSRFAFPAYVDNFNFADLEPYMLPAAKTQPQQGA